MQKAFKVLKETFGFGAQGGLKAAATLWIAMGRRNENDGFVTGSAVRVLT